MLHRGLPESEYGGHRPPFVGDQYPVHVSVISDAAADGCLPVDGVVFLRLYPREVRVLHVDQEPALLAEVSVQHVADHLCRPFVPLHHRRAVRRHFEDEAFVVSDSLLAQALCFGEEARCALWIKPLLNKTPFLGQLYWLVFIICR